MISHLSSQTPHLASVLEGKKRKEVYREFALKEFISGHKIDYVKGDVAIDMEWNIVQFYLKALQSPNDFAKLFRIALG